MIQVQQEPAHRIGRAPAVIHDFAEIGVTALGHVLGERRKQVAEQADRQPMRGDHRRQIGKQWQLRRLPAFDAIQLGGEPGKFVQTPFLRQVALVGKIIGLAGKRVDQLDRTAQPLRQQRRGNREVLVVIDRHRQ